ncbi:unnamed protein product [Meganyctiphanes norvegica]|uniref:Uncharacterized protein n=1 Tax=Meganyctiphanes norvegica TaxID=48144 RepID=A0AAV2RH61_MEGNR
MFCPLERTSPEGPADAIVTPAGSCSGVPSARMTPEGPTRGRERLTTFWTREPSDITWPEGPSRITWGAAGALNWVFMPSLFTIPEGPTTTALAFCSAVSVALSGPSA